MSFRIFSRMSQQASHQESSFLMKGTLGGQVRTFFTDIGSDKFYQKAFRLYLKAIAAGGVFGAGFGAHTLAQEASDKEKTLKGAFIAGGPAFAKGALGGGVSGAIGVAGFPVSLYLIFSCLVKDHGEKNRFETQIKQHAPRRQDSPSFNDAEDVDDIENDCETP